MIKESTGVLAEVASGLRDLARKLDAVVARAADTKDDPFIETLERHEEMIAAVEKKIEELDDHIVGHEDNEDVHAENLPQVVENIVGELDITDKVTEAIDRYDFSGRIEDLIADAVKEELKRFTDRLRIVVD